ncbi:hypothetical protein EYC84_008798 [Monilinia fructicola]|uniref:Uncharacterized protein n=1 Tax=Monilinia fructicola TaxID=38448 RepID=A0A5M9JBS2_MONFR|nr:hypothetical protein EYC84_008798 [Monilinia fructicola]
MYQPVLRVKLERNGISQFKFKRSFPLNRIFTHTPKLDHFHTSANTEWTFVHWRFKASIPQPQPTTTTISYHITHTYIHTYTSIRLLKKEAIFEWSDHSTSPDRDDVEEIIRQTQGGYRFTPRQPRVVRAPTRRRVQIDESCDHSSVNFQHYKFERFDMRAGSMDGSDGSNSSAITVITSATSSCGGDPWSSGGFVEEEEEGHEHNESAGGSWDGEHTHEHPQEQDVDMLLEPKLEPLEEELNLESVAPRTPTTVLSPMQAKRPRGRPRKHPIQTTEPLNKVTKGRSKTGLYNLSDCEKNAVVCEGYPEKQVWKSGKEKAEEGTTLWRYQRRQEELIMTPQHPDVNRETLEERSQYHHAEAMKELHHDLDRQERGDIDNIVISARVDDGIALLAQVPPRDPAQTLVLAPAFIIGCAAFEKRQRDPIRKAIGVVKAYMEYRNSDAALRVLEEVWKLMDEKDERSWDWQSLAHNMGMDFLAT